ncbi:hypothetical protein GCM10009594_12210 [Kocuria palustris]|nr:hypothetical protein Kosp01_10000 [Kocuria sp. NBRC 114282]
MGLLPPSASASSWGLQRGSTPRYGCGDPSPFIAPGPAAQTAGSDAPAGEDDAADSGSPDHDASSDDDVWGRESCSEAMPGSFWVWSWFGSCGERPLEAADTLIR